MKASAMLLDAMSARLGTALGYFGIDWSIVKLAEPVIRGSS